MKRNAVFGLGGLLALGAIESCEPRIQDDRGAVPQPVLSPPTLEELANATYTGVLDTPVRLDSGRWAGAPFVPGGASRPTVQLLPDFRLAADLDDNPGEEAVVFLAENSGGSGTQTYLAVVGRLDDSVVHLAAAPLGDRIQLHSARVDDGRIALSVIQQGPADPACCPTQKATEVWDLDGSKLIQVSSRITGVLSLADLGDGEWVLTHLTSDEPVPAEPEITLVLRGNQLSGTSGCNRYFAEVEPGDQPGDMLVGAVGTTRRSCETDVMEREDRYLDALGSAVRYGFRAGQLAVTWRRDATSRTMRFSPIQD